MTYERAAEILDPEHRETYESLEIVNEACRMGRAALFRRMPEPPHPDGDESILACPTCGGGEYLYNEDGNRCCFCGWCGQAIDWNAETFKAAGQMKPVLKYPGSKWRLAEWIVSLMPPHKSYLEPFFGSGAVFFKKPPEPYRDHQRPGRRDHQPVPLYPGTAGGADAGRGLHAVQPGRV